MKRLTTDKPVREMTMTELAHNSCYRAADGNARYRDFGIDADARQFIIHLLEKFAGETVEYASAEEFDEVMLEALAEGTDTLRGVLALLYEQIWSKAELREYLRVYEDTGLTPEQAEQIAKDISGASQGGVDAESVCPVCGKEITYDGAINLDDDGGCYPWTCEYCGATGKEGFNFAFDRHYNVQDKNGKPIPGRPE